MDLCKSTGILDFLKTLCGGKCDNDKCCKPKVPEKESCISLRPRDYHMLRVLDFLKKGMQRKNQPANAVHIAKAVKEMQRWKRRVYKDILEDLEDRRQMRKRRARKRACKHEKKCKKNN